MSKENPSLWQDPLPAIAKTETTQRPRYIARNLLWIVIILCFLLAITPWQQNISGHGRVIAYDPQERQQSIEATVEGRVVSWSIGEGSEVKTGDIIGEISDYDANLNNRLADELKALTMRQEAIQSRINALTNQLSLAENSRSMAIVGADARIKMAQERFNASSHQLDAANATLETARINVERQRALLSKGLVSRRAYELVELEFTQRKTDLDRTKATLNAARTEIHALEADQQKLDSDTHATVEKYKSDLEKAREDLQSSQGERLRLETRLARQATQYIIAPREGTIFRILANPNAEVVKPGDALAILIPKGVRRAVELMVDGNDAPLIDLGRRVRLQFEGYPAIQFSGWPETAVGTFGGIVTLIDSTDNGKGDFRILVVADPKDSSWPDERFIRQGVRVNGWILLNQVKLGYEVWRNFNGFPPLIRPEQNGSHKK